MQKPLRRPPRRAARRPLADARQTIVLLGFFWLCRPGPWAIRADDLNTSAGGICDLACTQGDVLAFRVPVLALRAMAGRARVDSASMGEKNTAGHRGVSLESQTFRALLEMRELILRGEFRPGERLREVPLATRLNVSRTPLRLVLDRLAQEGLLKARPTGGFVANEFGVEDIRDAIEIRGVLEGAAAHRAAERFKTADECTRLRAVVVALDALVRQTSAIDSMEFFARYIDLNGQFHAMVLELAKSAMLSRSMEHVLTLPFASPNAFFLTETETVEGRETILVSQAHHRAIASAIIDGEAARAETLAREHSRLARTNLEMALKQHNLTRIPGASLVKFPEAI
jgi:GntR family transcriptional regulator of vanillate catabolism